MVGLICQRGRVPCEDGHAGTVGVGLVLQHLNLEAAFVWRVRVVGSLRDLGYLVGTAFEHLVDVAGFGEFAHPPAAGFVADKACHQPDTTFSVLSRWWYPAGV